MQWACRQTKFITIKHPFHMQWAYRQTELYYKTPTSHAIGLPANEITTIKHPIHLQ